MLRLYFGYYLVYTDPETALTRCLMSLPGRVTKRGLATLPGRAACHPVPIHNSIL